MVVRAAVMLGTPHRRARALLKSTVHAEGIPAHLRPHRQPRRIATTVHAPERPVIADRPIQKRSHVNHFDLVVIAEPVASYKCFQRSEHLAFSLGGDRPHQHQPFVAHPAPLAPAPRHACFVVRGPAGFAWQWIRLGQRVPLVVAGVVRGVHDTTPAINVTALIWPSSYRSTDTENTLESYRRNAAINMASMPRLGSTISSVACGPHSSNRAFT